MSTESFSKEFILGPKGVARLEKMLDEAERGINKFPIPDEFKEFVILDINERLKKGDAFIRQLLKDVSE